MMEDLLAWFRAQLDEDERVAGEAEHWTNLSDEGWPFDVSDSDRRIALAEAWRDRFTPRQRLAEVAVTRRILDEVVSAMDGMDDRIDGEWGMGQMGPDDYESLNLIKLLALPYASQPGYREEWRP